MATVSNIRIYKNGHGIKYNISIIFSFMQVVLKVYLPHIKAKKGQVGVAGLGFNDYDRIKYIII